MPARQMLHKFSSEKWFSGLRYSLECDRDGHTHARYYDGVDDDKRKSTEAIPAATAEMPLTVVAAVCVRKTTIKGHFT